MFEWDEVKDTVNQLKHGVSFDEAQNAFSDPHRIIYEDVTHSQIENRFYCLGLVESRVMTVRFTYRNTMIRIIGAGYWRKGEKIYVERSYKNTHGIH